VVTAKAEAVNRAIAAGRAKEGSLKRKISSHVGLIFTMH
jgi:hypothetical protein